MFGYAIGFFFDEMRIKKYEIFLFLQTTEKIIKFLMFNSKKNNKSLFIELMNELNQQQQQKKMLCFRKISL